MAEGTGSAGWVAICMLAGCILLPYNSLLVAQAYFDRHAFPGLEFPFVSMLCYTAPLCITQAVLTFVGDRFTINGRMWVANVSTILICLCYVAIICLARMGVAKEPLYGLCLLNCFGLALANSVMQTSLLGLATAMGTRYSAAAMVGLGTSGIAAFALTLLLELALGASAVAHDEGAAAAQAAALFIFCGAYTVLSTWVYHGWLTCRIQVGTETIKVLEDNRQRTRSAREVHPHALGAEGGEARSAALLQGSGTSLWQHVAPVMWQTATQASNLGLTFATTMSVFPGVMDRWVPNSAAFASKPDLFDRLLTGVFQLFDLAGRFCAGRSVACFHPRLIRPLVLIRLLFIPAFILGQRSPGSCVLWGTDLGRFVLVALLAASNGFCGALTMIFGPQDCSSDRRELAATAMSSTMVFGIFAGTLLAFATQV